MMRQLMLLVAVVAAAVLAAAPASADASMTSLVLAYRDTLAAGDCAGFAALFADDASFFGPQGNAFVGPGAIDTFCQQTLQFASIVQYDLAEILLNGDARAAAKYLVVLKTPAGVMATRGWNAYFAGANTSAEYGYLFTNVAGFAQPIAYPQTSTDAPLFF